MKFFFKHFNSHERAFSPGKNLLVRIFIFRNNLENGFEDCNFIGTRKDYIEFIENNGQPEYQKSSYFNTVKNGTVLDCLPGFSIAGK